jgi:hypothetical protein
MLSLPSSCDIFIQEILQHSSLNSNVILPASCPQEAFQLRLFKRTGKKFKNTKFRAIFGTQDRALNAVFIAVSE